LHKNVCAAEGLYLFTFQGQVVSVFFTYLFNSTGSVISAVIMAFDVSGCGEEEPSAPQRYAVV